MIQTQQDLVVEAFQELASMYPDMRLGQLLLMAATLASETTLREVGSIPDDELANAIQGHIRQRQLVAAKATATIPAADEKKETLFVALQSIPRASWDTLGTVVTHLANQCGHSLYDVEDSELMCMLH